MSHVYLLLLFLLSFFSSGASVAVFPVSQTAWKLRNLQQKINDLMTKVDILEADIKKLQSQAPARSNKVSCSPNWFPVIISGSLAYCIFPSATSGTWTAAQKYCWNQDSRLLSLGGEPGAAQQLEDAVRITLTFQRLRGNFWIGLRGPRLAWTVSSDLGPVRWHVRMMQFIEQPCGVLWLHRKLWTFDDCRSSNRWLCIQRPKW